MIKRLLILLLLCSSVLGQVPYQKPMLGQQIDWSNPLSKGLVGYWLMNEGTGNTVVDLSGYSGTLDSWTGALQWAAGKFGPCLYFNGDDAYIQSSISPQYGPTTAFTVSMWIMPTADNYAETLIGWNEHGGSYGIRIWLDPVNGSDSAIGVYLRTVGTNTGTTSQFALNQWHHLCVTYDGAVIKYYRNAHEDDSDVDSGVLDYAYTDPITLGADYDGTGLYEGYMDDVLVYNRALSASEVTDLCSNPFGLSQPTFSVWWYSGIGGEAPATFGQVIMIGN